MVTSTDKGLTDKQLAFIDSYVVKLSGIQAARDAGYTGNVDSLAVTASRILSDAKVKLEMNRRFAEHIMSPEELLRRMSHTATANVKDFVDEAGNVDLRKLHDAGHGALVREIAQTSQGTKLKLHDASRAQELLAKYHQLLTDRIDVTSNGKTVVTEESINKLGDIIARAMDRDDTA